MYFARIIGRSPLKPIAAIVDNADWFGAPFAAQYRAIHRRPQHAGLSMLLSVLKDDVNLTYKEDSCAVLLDHDYGSIEQAGAVYGEWCRRSGLPEDYFAIAHAKPGSIEKQCADLVAGAIRLDKVFTPFHLTRGPLGPEFERRHSDPGFQLVNAITSGKAWRSSAWSLELQRRADEAITRLSQSGESPEQSS